MAHHFLQSSIGQSSIGDVPQRVDSLTLGRTRPAWGLVDGGRGAEHDAAVPPAPKRTLPIRTDSADVSSFSMSGFG
jgi:hypothetical protein